MRRFVIKTNRLGLRKWEQADYTPFIEMNQDAAVMKYFPVTINKEETQALIHRIEQHFDTYGFGFYAVETLDNHTFIGFIGLKWISFENFFTPGVEIGWRLKKEAWNQGYATEGAKACVSYGFETLGLDKIFSFTTHNNAPSEKVMIKIGMKKAGEFNHPNMPAGHFLERHVLYQKVKS